MTMCSESLNLSSLEIKVIKIMNEKYKADLKIQETLYENLITEIPEEVPGIRLEYLNETISKIKDLKKWIHMQDNALLSEKGKKSIKKC